LTSRDLAYWLQGFFELRQPNQEISAEQAEIIRKHLALVFIHEIDPSMGPPEHQKVLDAVHSGTIEDAVSGLPPRIEGAALPEPAWKVRPPDGTVYRC
jgi:hypothetical protein